MSELKKLAQNVPCSDKLIAIAEKELTEGNILLALDEVSMFPGETYYICQFKYFSKQLRRV